MKKILLLLLILFLIFMGCMYWSISIQPEVVKLSEVVSSGIDQGDSVQVIPTNQYEGNWIKRFMQGRNYREAWSTPVTAPVLYLDSMNIVSEGGGKQTHSLRLKTTNGTLYSLRSINKDPRPLIPNIARFFGLENIIMDGVSAQHPYGAQLAAVLAEDAGILHTSPKKVYVPHQKNLGKYNDSYGNKMYLLEYETEGQKNWTQFQNVLEIMDTDDLQTFKMKNPGSVRIDKRAFVRARLFDLWIGDWDRHAKQWGWVVQQDEKEYTAIPLPGDRDNAFFRIDGVIPTILTNELIQPMVRPFEGDIDHIPGYVYPIDAYFLTDTPEEIFLQEAKYLQEVFTEEKIENAFDVWPQEIRKLNEREITSKLLQRKARLQEYAIALKAEIDNRSLLQEPLKGSEDIDLPLSLLRCFNCQ